MPSSALSPQVINLCSVSILWHILYRIRLT